MSVEELRTVWAGRDQRYVLRREPLSPGEVAIVREWRIGETAAVHPLNRAAIRREAEFWQPPMMVRQVHRVDLDAVFREAWGKR